MRLRPFAVDDAATVAGWPASEEEATMWCGHTGGPVPAEKVRAWSTEEGVRPFGLYDDDRLIAYGELWVDDDEAEVELARLIVEPGHRGRGVGRALVAALVAQARLHHPDVFMRVHPGNGSALRCYAAAGFIRVPEDLEDEWNAQQPVAYVWLTYPG